MFAMLVGPWPRVTLEGARLADVEAAVLAGEATEADLETAVARVVAEAVAAQVEAGMELVTDGSVRWADPGHAVLDAIRTGDTGPDGLLVRAWRTAAELTDVPLAQAIPGPWTLATRDIGDEAGVDALAARAGELADGLAGELAALAEAGCRVVEVLEPEAVRVEASDRGRSGFRDAHRRLLQRSEGLHAMLAVVGGSAHGTGADSMFDAPYHSYLVDLIAGPDNWYLVRAAPGERGIVVAAFRAGEGRERLDQAPELSWAAHYAASANGRGLDRVGVANASSLAELPPADARVALERMARAAGLAAMRPADAIKVGLEPAAILREDQLPAFRRQQARERLANEPAEPPGEPPGHR